MFHWLFTFFWGLFEQFYPRLLYKPREWISSLDLSELPGGLFGRKERHEEQRNEYANRLQRHNKNSKRGWKQSCKETPGNMILVLFSVLKIILLLVYSHCIHVWSHFFKKMVYGPNAFYIVTLCQYLSAVLWYHAGQNMWMYN